MIGDYLFRPYIKGTKRPITTKWYRTKEEAVDWAKTFDREPFEIRQREINSLLKNRKKTGFRGLV